jgi:hypothetical protein
VENDGDLVKNDGKCLLPCSEYKIGQPAVKLYRRFTYDKLRAML